MDSSISSPLGDAQHTPEHSPRKRRKLLTIGLVVLSISCCVLAYRYYESRIYPLWGYGNEPEALSFMNTKPAKALSGGDLTHFKFGTVSFEEPAANLPWQIAAEFDIGDGLFERRHLTAKIGYDRFDGDGVGPLFNMASCEGCHVADGRAAPPEVSGQVLEGLLFRVSVPGKSDVGGPKPHPIYGGQLADKAVDGQLPEIEYTLDFEAVTGQFADGQTYELQKPIYRFVNMSQGPLEHDAMVSPRIAPFMIGMGLLDAISNESILERSDELDRNQDGISGKPNWVWDIQEETMAIGKYGWKAETPTLAQQAMDAAVNDRGLTNPFFPSETCRPTQTKCGELLAQLDSTETELNESQMDAMVTYLAFLGVPGRDYLDNPEVQRGEVLFNDLGCESCHRATFTTGDDYFERRLRNQVIHPYTDLLLHNMGEGLADHRPTFDADGYEWRTPPLWGIGMVKAVNGHTRFLHDGRARNLEEAVLWHGGEAEQAKQGYTQLSENDRASVIKFLKSL
jgi:CxxC motif-containing protein (DUF1111 family)